MVRGNIISSMTTSLLTLRHCCWGTKKVGMLAKNGKREEYGLFHSLSRFCGTNWAREVQALLEQFVRLGHLGLATVEPSGTQILRKYLRLRAVVGLGLSYRTAFNLQLPHRAASAFCQAQRSERFSCREGIWEYQPTLT